MSTAQPAPAREKNVGQISPLPGVTTYVTGNNASGQAAVQETRPGQWLSLDEDSLAFNVVYTNSFNADLNEDKDLKAHNEVMAERKFGLVKPGGVICRQVNFASASS